VCVCACQKPKENGSFPPDMCVCVCIWWVAISHLVSAGGKRFRFELWVCCHKWPTHRRFGPYLKRFRIAIDGETKSRKASDKAEQKDIDLWGGVHFKGGLRSLFGNGTICVF